MSTHSMFSSFRSKEPVGKQATYHKNVGFRPGFDTHHAHLPGLVLIKDARDVDIESDAKHYTHGPEVHHQSMPQRVGVFTLPLLGGYE